MDDESDAEQREAADAFGQAVAIVQTEQLQRAVEERPQLPVAWRRASALSDWGLELTSASAERLVRAIGTLVEGWPEDAGDPDAEQFVVVVDSFLRPGRTTLGEQ